MATKSTRRPQRNHVFSNYMAYTGYEDPTRFTDNPKSPYWTMRAMMLEIDLRKIAGQIETNMVINPLRETLTAENYSMNLSMALDAEISIAQGNDPYADLFTPDPYSEFFAPDSHLDDIDSPVDYEPLGGW